MTSQNAGGVAKGSRKADAAATRSAILQAAIEEFSQQGFNGGRLETIAEHAGVAKRMIYYYFDSKEGLYLAVLDDLYLQVQRGESTSDLDSLPPIEAIQRMAEETLDFQESTPSISRLILFENIQQGKFITQLAAVEQARFGVIRKITDILARGVEQGVFRSGIDPVDVHMMISAFCAFRVNNRHTFGRLFGRDMLSAQLRDHHKAMLTELILRFLRAD